MPEVATLEKVEVLKGGSALLFGNVTPGGIVNLVTKKPLFKNGREISVNGKLCKDLPRMQAGWEETHDVKKKHKGFKPVDKKEKKEMKKEMKKEEKKS